MNLQSFVPHILLFIITICLAEYAFQEFWNKRYFKYGISVLRIAFKNNAKFHELPIKSLESKFKGVTGPFGIPIIPAIKFGHISERFYAFREMFTFCAMYLPIFHGAIDFNPKYGKIIFSVRLNYFPLIALAIICPLLIEVYAPGERGWVGPLLLYIIFSFIQLVRNFYIFMYIKYLFRKPIKEKAQQLP